MYEEMKKKDGHLNTPTYERADDEASKKVYKKLVKLCERHKQGITRNEKKSDP